MSNSTANLPLTGDIIGARDNCLFRQVLEDGKLSVELYDIETLCFLSDMIADKEGNELCYVVQFEERIFGKKKFVVNWIVANRNDSFLTLIGSLIPLRDHFISQIDSNPDYSGFWNFSYLQKYFVLLSVVKSMYNEYAEYAAWQVSKEYTNFLDKVIEQGEKAAHFSLRLKARKASGTTFGVGKDVYGYNLYRVIRETVKLLLSRPFLPSYLEESAVIFNAPDLLAEFGHLKEQVVLEQNLYNMQYLAENHYFLREHISVLFTDHQIKNVGIDEDAIFELCVWCFEQLS